MNSERKNRLQSLGTAKPATETGEDYLACILELLEKKGYARVVDVANSLSVAEASACSMIKSLANTGYVKRERYRGFTLTESGRAMAREIHARRRILTAFLQSLGLPESVVLHDVHGLEHHLSEQTLERLKRFVQETRADQKLSRLVVQAG
jgi:DtxR family transcriptional regulator, manganese transport regulator